MNLLPGRLLIVKDPPEDRKGSILYPDVEKIYAASGYVLLHERERLDEDLTHKRIIFQKRSARDFEWNGTTLSVLKEGTVLAIFDEESES